MNVYSSSTDIITQNLQILATNFLSVLAIIIGISFGFYFLWKLIRKAKNSVDGNDYSGEIGLKDGTWQGNSINARVMRDDPSTYPNPLRR